MKTDSRPDPVIEAVCRDLQRRSDLGIAKYGTTLFENRMHLRAWLQHAYEECLDQANYLKRAMMEMDSEQTNSVPRLRRCDPQV